jgi:hypothetical protein
MKAIKHFAMLAVLVTLTAVGFQAFAANATGSAAQIFELGKGSTKLMGALFVPVGIYIVAKTLT